MLLPEVIPPDELGVTFDHIGALDNVKETLRELVMLPLQRPELFVKGQLTKVMLLFLQIDFWTEQLSSTLWSVEAQAWSSFPLFSAKSFQFFGSLCLLLGLGASCRTELCLEFSACSPAEVYCCLDHQALARPCLQRQLQQRQGQISSTSPCPQSLPRW